MFDQIIATLPADLQEEIACHLRAHGPVLGLAQASPMDDRLHLLPQLYDMSATELADTLARWTGYASYLSSLIVVTNIVSKCIEKYVEIHEAKVRMTARAKSPNISNSELSDMVVLDALAMNLRDAVQGLAEVKGVVGQRERACCKAAEAASRAITARQVDVQQLRLEARR